ncbi:MAG: vWA domain-containing protein, partial [Planctomycetota bacterium]
MNLPIRMTAALSPWTVWTIAISVSLLVLIVYSRDSRHLRGLSSFMLPGLRAGAVFLALLTLGKPVWYRETTVGTLGKVIFAIDSSASMSIDDGQELNRLQRALELVYGEADGWCERLSETHEVTSLGFDSIGRKINNDSNLLPDGSITNLAAPLESVSTNVPESLERQATQEDSSSVALVILSDGQHNAVEGYLDRAGELADRSMQVHAIVMGESKTPRDLAILDVDLPTLISDDARVSGDIQIRKVGEWPEGVQVSMMTPDGAPIDSFEVPTGTGVFTLPIDLDGAELVKAMTSPSIAGESAASSEPQVLDLRFEIVAPFDPSEAPEKITSNNIQAHRIAVNRGKKRLLLLEGVPRWEARYLRNFFSRDVAWNVETIHTSESRDAVSSRTGNRLSLQAEEIAGYDVIVV